MAAYRQIKNSRREYLRFTFAAPVSAALSTFTVRAADGPYPDRPIHCVIPFPVGGTSDLLARLVGAHLGAALGQPVIIESKQGAAGAIAMQYVAKAPPDGYTIFFANNGTNTILRSRQREEGVDLMRSFAPIIKLATLPIVIVVPPSTGVKTLRELVDRARRAPGSLAFATSDVGSTSHLAASTLFQRADVQLIHIPYAGTALGVKDVLAGEVQVLFTHIATVAALLRAGRLMPLAVTGNHRMPAFSNIPTVAESGFPGFDITTWHGILVPVGTPPAIIARLHAELATMMESSEMRSQVVDMGMEPMASTPEQFAADLEADVEHWARIAHPSATRVE